MKPNTKFCNDMRVAYSAAGDERYCPHIDVSTNYVGPNGILPILELSRNLKSLQTLDARSNMLTHDVIEKLVEAFISHPTLWSIDLRDNLLHDGSVPLLLHLLRSNRHITDLKIDRNDVHSQSMAVIAAAVDDNRHHATQQREADLADGSIAADNRNRAAVRYVPYKCTIRGSINEANSGGSPSQYASWRKNPQYYVYVTHSCTVTLSLRIDDPQPTRQLSFVVLRGQDPLRYIEDIQAADIVAEGNLNEAFVTCNIRAEAADRRHGRPYVVIPHTFSPNRCASFELIAEFDPQEAGDGAAITIEAVDPKFDWCVAEVQGGWGDGSAGGTTEFDSWRRNDYYRLVAGDARAAISAARLGNPNAATSVNLFVCLTKANDVDDNDEKEIGLYVMRPPADTTAAATGREPLSRRPLRISDGTIIHYLQPARRTSVTTTFRLPMHADSLDIFFVPVTSKPGQLGPYTLTVYATTNIRLEPSYYQQSTVSDWCIGPTLRGVWDTHRNGGNAKDNPTTWKHCPCYELIVPSQAGPIDLHVSLTDPVVPRDLSCKASTVPSVNDAAVLLLEPSDDLTAVSMSPWAPIGRGASEAELWVNGVPPGTYFLVPQLRVAGGNKVDRAYAMLVTSSAVVQLSEDVPLSIRLRERQLRRYEDENRLREQQQSSNSAADGTAATSPLKLLPAGPAVSAPTAQGSFDLEQARIVRDAVMQAYLSTGDLFVDRDFPRGPSSLFKNAMAHPTDPAQEALSNVDRWVRLSEWAPHLALAARDEGGKPGSGALHVTLAADRSPEPTVQDAWGTPTGDPLRHGGVIVGDYNTSWFFSALAVVVTRRELFQQFVVAALPEFGLYQFRFFHNGRWTTVTVDDFIPIDSAGRACFSVSRCPMDVLCMMAEKAFAKLNRCYEALHIVEAPWPEPAQQQLLHANKTIPPPLSPGSEALLDLTGGVAKEQSLFHLPAAQDGSNGQRLNVLDHHALWDQLLRCRDPNFVASLRLSHLTPRAQEKKHSGVRIDHLYPVIDARVVEGHKLVRIRNFFAADPRPSMRSSPPASGGGAVLTLRTPSARWSNDSDSWTPTIRRAVAFVPDDTTFWLSLDEVIQLFGVLHTTEFPSFQTWLNDGHFIGNQTGGDLGSPTWATNPQFSLSVQSVEPVVVTLSFHQMDQRSILTREDTADVRYDDALGLVALPVPSNARRLLSLDPGNCPHSAVTCPAATQRDQFVQVTVRPSTSGTQWIVMPFSPKGFNFDAPFSLSARACVPVTLQLLSADRSVSAEGEWRGNTAGGSRDFGTWRNNPQYHLYPSASGLITVVLRQRNELCSTANWIGFDVFDVSDLRSAVDSTHLNKQVCACAHQNAHAAVANVFLQGMAERRGRPYLIVPSCSRPFEETGFTLEIVANQRLSLQPVPATLDWRRSMSSGSFSSGCAGGSLRFSSWRSNPQFIITFPTEQQGRLVINLARRNLGDRHNEIGVVVMHYASPSTASAPTAPLLDPKCRRRKLICPAGDVLAQSTLSRETSVDLELDFALSHRSAALVLMPFVDLPYSEIDYTLSVYCTVDFSMRPCEEWPHQAQCDGCWLPGLTAGGCREQHASWINNPFFGLSLTHTPTRVVIVALQYPKGPEKPVFRKVGNRRVAMPPPITNEGNRIAFGVDVVRDAASVERALASGQAYSTPVIATPSDYPLISSSGHTRNHEVVMTVELPACERTPYLVVPHTVATEENCDFKLYVYADAPVTLFPVEKGRRTY